MAVLSNPFPSYTGFHAQYLKEMEACSGFHKRELG